MYLYGQCRVVAAVAFILTLFMSWAVLAQPTIVTHDNLKRAGEQRGNKVTIRLYAGLGRWYPEGQPGSSLSVQAFGEEGRGLEIPGPLVRVPAGTTIEASIRNSLDVPLELHGFSTRPMAADQPVVIAPSETRVLTFAAGTPGTYHYWATTTQASIFRRFNIDSQLSGAFVVDEPGAPEDRIFVTTLWSETEDVSGLKPSNRINFLINGRAWPHTSRLTYDEGDEVRWRVINLSNQPHPMHLHGFYFTVRAAGMSVKDDQVVSSSARQVVTELVRPGGTMQMSWIAERPGNWLFHCHIAEHMAPHLSVAAPTERRGDHSGHESGMGGMVIGLTIRPRSSPRPVVPSSPARRLTLTMKTVPERFGRETGFGFALDGSEKAITPGPALVLTRGEPVHVTLVNELPEATAIHWHGIELDSYYDGVPGFSGSSGSITPSVAPRERFDVRFTPPRSGTFIYHTHSHDSAALAKGLYGALIVVEPGQRYDPATDHVLIIGVNGSERGAAGERDESLLNGELSPSISLKAGVPNRLRLINITADRPGLTFAVMKGTAVANWKMLAKDGADLPEAQRVAGPAQQQVAVGETYDFEITPTADITSIDLSRRGSGELLIRARVTVAQNTPPIRPDVERMDAVVRFYADDPQRSFMGVVLVARGADVHLAKGYGMANVEWSVPNTPTTRFALASNSKQFTAAAILLLEERGKLRVTDSIKSHFPDAPAAWDAITFHHLLSHTSGLISTAPAPRGTLSLPARPDQTLERFRNLPLQSAPGARYGYSNAGYQLLAYLIERVSGQRYEDFIAENILKPLGMNESGSSSHAAIVPSRASGYARGPRGAVLNAAPFDLSNGMGAGSLYSTVGDLHRWTIGLFGGKLLRADSLTRMTTAIDGGYAYGLGVDTTEGRRRFSHGGSVSGFASYLIYYPESQVTVAVLSNVPRGPADDRRPAVRDIAEWLGTLAHGGTVTLPTKQ
jgi:CubicO group peptidase (beta-lactamase class C family)